MKRKCHHEPLTIQLNSHERGSARVIICKDVQVSKSKNTQVIWPGALNFGCHGRLVFTCLCSLVLSNCA